MAFKTDIQIAREAKKRPIQEIGDKLGIPSDHLLPYGHDKAKVSQDFINSTKSRDDGKLILGGTRKSIPKVADSEIILSLSGERQGDRYRLELKAATTTGRPAASATSRPSSAPSRFSSRTRPWASWSFRRACRA